MSQATKRVTAEDDYKRLAERVWNRGRGKIETRADFEAVYTTYMKSGHAPASLKDSTWGELKSRHKGLSEKTTTKKARHELFKEAGSTPAPKEFDIWGRSKGKKIITRRTVIRVRGREQKVYRDKKGRFASVK